MLWMWNALMRFAQFPTINSVLSNPGDLRRNPRHVVGFSMENRPPMTRREGRLNSRIQTNGANILSVVRPARHMNDGLKSRG
jgi:hypothetical protein